MELRSRSEANSQKVDRCIRSWRAQRRNKRLAHSDQRLPPPNISFTRQTCIRKGMTSGRSVCDCLRRMKIPMDCVPLESSSRGIQLGEGSTSVTVTSSSRCGPKQSCKAQWWSERSLLQDAVLGVNRTFSFFARGLAIPTFYPNPRVLALLSFMTLQPGETIWERCALIIEHLSWFRYFCAKLLQQHVNSRVSCMFLPMDLILNLHM